MNIKAMPLNALRFMLRPIMEKTLFSHNFPRGTSLIDKQYFVLSFSNINDCARWGLSKNGSTPWNWASNWVLEMSNPRHNDRVLDLACINNPYVIKHFVRNNVKATFVDIQPKPDDVVLPANINFIQLDLVDALPFEDNSFDVILSESSLEHLAADSRLYALKEAIRCLRPNGRMAVSIGLPIGFGGDPETINAFQTHDYFGNRHCNVFFPIDVKQIVECIDPSLKEKHHYPCNYLMFPGFEQYDENVIRRDNNILLDKYADHPDVPDIAKLRSVAVVEIGIYFNKLG